jgi:hypothetical protein
VDVKNVDLGSIDEPRIATPGPSSGMQVVVCCTEPPAFKPFYPGKNAVQNISTLPQGEQGNRLIGVLK